MLESQLSTAYLLLAAVCSSVEARAQEIDGGVASTDTGPAVPVESMAVETETDLDAAPDLAGHMSSDAFHFTTIRTWAYRDFLPGDDHTDVLGFEFNSAWGWGDFDVANISYFEVARYPRAVPGRPGGNPFDPNDPDNFEGADGITDLLTAFLFSKKGKHEGPHHFGYGFASQFPTASDNTLGSGKWSLGPALEYEYEKGRFFAAFVALQLWSVAGESDRKDVNMLMVKPMITYEVAERWKAVYMPYGISQYWNKPSGQQLYVPVGGGVQYGFNVKGLDMATSVQFFNYAVRPDGGAENEVRFRPAFTL